MSNADKSIDDNGTDVGVGMAVGGIGVLVGTAVGVGVGAAPPPQADNMSVAMINNTRRFMICLSVLRWLIGGMS